MKKLCSYYFFKVFIDHLCDNHESGNRNYCLIIILMEKSLEKVLNFGSNNLYECCLCEEARSSRRTKSVIQHPLNCISVLCHFFE